MNIENSTIKNIDDSDEQLNNREARVLENTLLVLERMGKRIALNDITNEVKSEPSQVFCGVLDKGIAYGKPLSFDSGKGSTMPLRKIIHKGGVILVVTDDSVYFVDVLPES